MASSVRDTMASDITGNSICSPTVELDEVEAKEAGPLSILKATLDVIMVW